MKLTPDNWIALLPIIITSLTVVATMLAVAIKRNHMWNVAVCVAGLNLALVSCFWVLEVTPQQVTGLLLIDKFALFYDVIVLGAALVTATLSFNYMEGYAGKKEELYILLSLTALGGLVLVSATNFVTFFVGMEITAVSMYGMIGYPHRDRRALEASIKYMILSAIAGAFILFGMALIYAQTGTLSFDQLANGLASGSFAASGLLVTGGALIIVGVGFEVSLVPFHLWAPDVYEGAPAPVGGYLATASKAAMFAVILRYFIDSHAYESALLLDILSAMAVLSIVIGNVLALLQQNIKRMLAYSAIAHFGYALVAFVATGAFAVEAVGFYLASYVVTTLGAFGVIAILSTPIKASDADTLYDYRGQFWRRPYLAAILTIMLMSLAGAPMTALFIGKLYVFAAGIDQRMWVLVGAVVFGSAAGLFYYSRAAIVMFQRRRWVEPFKAPKNWTFQAGGMTVITLTLLMLMMGIYPEPIIGLIKAAGLHAPQVGTLAVNLLPPR